MQKHNTIRNKVAISYLLLVILAALAIGVLYKGINNIVLLDANATKPNQKLKQINQILTHVYEAESYSRSYFLFRTDSLLNIYIQSNENISKGIDSLKVICHSNPGQTKNLNEITELLKKKEEIIKKLLNINESNEQKILYERVLDEVYFNTYADLNSPSIIKQNITTKRDSIFEIQEKTGFFNKVKKVFSSTPETSEKKFTKTIIEQAVTYDTIAPKGPSNEEVLGTLEAALNNFKIRNELLKKQYVSQETGLLHSDRIILDRIRSIISSLEDEEISKTTNLLARSQRILNDANNSVIMLGGVALLLVLIFLFIIYRDISRTKAYQHELQKAQKYSEDLLRLKEQFVANMSHEIRTPLSAIIGFSEQLKKTVPNRNQEVFIHNIEQSSRHLHALINNVLDLSKSNAGKLTLDKTSFRLNELINETCQLFTNDAKTKGLELTYACDTLSETTVIGDKLKVKQILINIVGNAIKFTSKGMVKINVTAQDTNDLLKTTIEISDTGLGIPKDKIKYIFEEFSQADSNITRKFGGTGLGLSISKKMTELMKGNIAVKSEPNVGSTFTITIPFEKCLLEDCKEKSPTSDTAKLEGLKLLIVEDDETMRLLLGYIFNSYKVVGKFARTGKEALEQLEKSSFDLVLSDIQMPEMSGIELVKKIKHINNTLPVIAFTAHSSVPDRALNAGFDAFLTKPFTEKEIISVIAKTLGIAQIENTEQQVKPASKTREPESVSFTFRKLKEFTGTDEAAFLDIMANFFATTDSDLLHIENSLIDNNLTEVANKVHKLLPMFRQLEVNRIIDEMQMIERHKELELNKEDVKLFTSDFLEKARKIMADMKNEINATQAKKNKTKG